MNGMDKLDRNDLFVWDTRNTRGHGKRLKKTSCLQNVRKYSFSHRCIGTGTWNGLNSVTVEARCA